MNSNNRQPVYKEKVFGKRKIFHTEVKDGVTIFVDGKAPNPYAGVPCESLKLKSRIDAGTFENLEGSPIKLEKANGSDKAIEQIEAAEREFERKKEENYLKAAKKRMDDAYNEHLRKKLEVDIENN